MKPTIRYDRAAPLGNATRTKEGWIADSPVLTRTGIFTYTLPCGKMVREYRPDSEVFHPDALASLRGVPVTVEHPRLMDADTPADVIGAALTEGRRDAENMVGDIIIHRPARMGTRRELSLGYTVKLDETPGTFEGQPYDVVQREIRINHVAVVKAGRAGNARLRLDSEGNQVNDEPDQKDYDMKLATVKIDGIEYEVPPQVQVAISKMEQTLAVEKTRADTAEAARDTALAETTKAKGEVEQVRKDAVEGVRARLQLEATAKELKVEFKADATDRDIREAVIRKVRNDSKLDFTGKSDDYIGASYDLAIETKPRADSNAASQARELAQGTTKPGAERADDNKPAVPAGARNARNRMIQGLGR